MRVVRRSDAPAARRRMRRRCRATASSHPSRDSGAADVGLDPGTSDGNSGQCGSCVRIAASTSDTVTPENALSAREQLEDHATERPDVRPLVHRLSASLLRAHLGSGTADDTRRRAHDGHRRRTRDVRRRGGVPRYGLCQAEVEHPDRSIRGDLDVGGLHVAMDDPALVRGIERECQPTGDRRSPRETPTGAPARSDPRASVLRRAPSRARECTESSKPRSQQCLGWFNAASICASRSKRARRSRSSA